MGIASQDNDIPDHVAPERGGGGHATVSKGEKKTGEGRGPSKSVVVTTLSFSPAERRGQEKLIKRPWSE